MTRLSIFGGFSLVMGAVCAQEAPAPQQPLPYSHKSHLALGLKCAACHSNPEPGEAMGFPSEDFCLSCHRAIKPGSPHIRKLAAAAQSKAAIAWARVYQLPPYVYFSHRVHTAAGASCQTCHGPVSERDVLAREVSHQMRDCIACHKQKNARIDCSACHEER